MPHDQNEPKNNLIAIYALIAAVSIFIITFLLIYFIPFWLQAERRAKVELADTPDIRDLRIREDELLYRYARLDAQSGKVRIEIARAMELEAQQPWRRGLDLPERVAQELVAGAATASGTVITSETQAVIEAAPLAQERLDTSAGDEASTATQPGGDPANQVVVPLETNVSDLPATATVERE